MDDLWMMHRLRAVHCPPRQSVSKRKVASRSPSAWSRPSPARATCSSSDSHVSTAPTYSPSTTANGYYCYVVTDSEFTPVTASSSTDLVTVSPLPVPTLAISYSHSSVVVGSTVTCKTTVTSSTEVPTGNVAWSSSSPGLSSETTYKLSRGVCSVRFTPTSAGSPVILTAI